MMWFCLQWGRPIIPFRRKNQDSIFLDTGPNRHRKNWIYQKVELHCTYFHITDMLKTNQDSLQQIIHIADALIT